MNITPGYTTKAIVSLVDDPSNIFHNDKIRVRVPEIHGLGAMISSSYNMSNTTVSEDELPWANVQLPPISSIEEGEKSVQERINELYHEGDIVFVIFPSGSSSEILITGLYTSSQAAGLLDSDQNGGFSLLTSKGNLLASIFGGTFPEKGIENSIIEGGMVSNTENSNAKYANIFVSPVPKGTCYISSKFGLRNLAGTSSNYHAGIDLAGAKGTDICAIAAGTVTSAFNDNPANSGSLGNYGTFWYGGKLYNSHGGRGNAVTIDHGIINGKHFYSFYFHMNGTAVKVGDKVEKSQKIGILGHTGCSSGAHLHFQIQIGSSSLTRENQKKYAVNPVSYISF